MSEYQASLVVSKSWKYKISKHSFVCFSSPILVLKENSRIISYLDEALQNYYWRMVIECPVHFIW